ncbi:MAG: hypothetical protein ACF8NJ_08785 [Phycisphaerales bacterium JB038]
MEIIRRVLLLIGLLGGLFAFIYQRPILISVGVEDFAESKAQAEARPTGFLYRDESLQEFFDSRTEGRIQRTDGADWLAFHEKVRITSRGEPGPTDLRDRLGDSEYTQCLYFLTDEEPVRAYAAQLSEARPLLYLQIGADGPAAPTLTLCRCETADIFERPPAWLRYPLREYAPYLFAGGLACYLVLPRTRRREDTIRCHTMSAIVMPDILGAALTAVFFALPILVVQMNGGSLSLDAGGWLIIIAICWFLALFGIAIMAIACHSATHSIRLLDDSLRIRTWHGGSLIAYRDVVRLEAIEWRTPAWIRTIAWLLVLVSLRGVITALILDQGRGSGLRLHLANGSSERLWISGLKGWPRLVERLAAHGTTIDPEVQAMIEDV